MSKKRKRSETPEKDKEEKQQRRKSIELCEKMCIKILETSHCHLHMLSLFTKPILESCKTNIKERGPKDAKIVIKGKAWKNKEERLKELYGNDVIIINLLPEGDYPMFSTSRTWGACIAVPFCPDKPLFATSIERLWEGLKVYDEKLEIDTSIFKGGRLPHKSDKPFRGWLKGPFGKELLTTEEAHWYLALEPYKKILETKCQQDLQRLRDIIDHSVRVVFLDASQESDMHGTKLLSGAFMLKLYLDGNYPTDVSSIENRT